MYTLWLVSELELLISSRRARTYWRVNPSEGVDMETAIRLVYGTKILET